MDGGYENISSQRRKKWISSQTKEAPEAIIQHSVGNTQINKVGQGGGGTNKTNQLKLNNANKETRNVLRENVDRAMQKRNVSSEGVRRNPQVNRANRETSKVLRNKISKGFRKNNPAGRSANNSYRNSKIEASANQQTLSAALGDIWNNARNYFQEEENKLQNKEVETALNSQVLINHLLCPDVKKNKDNGSSSVSGGHIYDPNISQLVTGLHYTQIGVKDSHGVYKCEVSLNGIMSVKTMFPEQTSVEDAFKIADEAWQNKDAENVREDGSILRYGRSKNGIRICFIIRNQKIGTFFPIYESPAGGEDNTGVEYPIRVKMEKRTRKKRRWR